MMRRDCTITESREISGGIYLMSFEAGDIAREAAPGSFVHIKCGEGCLLRRPISIADAKGDGMTIVFEARGAGTRELARRRPGATADVLGPLGRGFGSVGGGTIAVGGGMGVPPLLFAARRAAPGSVTALLGFRDAGRVILEREFRERCRDVHIMTEDGSEGGRGTVEAPLREYMERGGISLIISCGPRPMLAAVARIAAQYGTPCRVSLEERMACGVGACLGCACETTDGDGRREMRRVCRDGPVFDSREVTW
ncbi:MAG: dihydroorotate dehydrogenase electron transfer subunit [Oscillospiraceae bacterium]|jgi:dihydroorotate dehydrogenase electron transfer subunit|nr:dihydroorotate dehydrogenase electron transfer subunit [Oscillospiraceae bacterium]